MWWIVFWFILAIALIVFVVFLCIMASGVEQDRLQDELDGLDGGE